MADLCRRWYGAVLCPDGRLVQVVGGAPGDAAGSETTPSSSSRGSAREGVESGGWKQVHHLGINKTLHQEPGDGGGKGPGSRGSMADKQKDNWSCQHQQEQEGKRETGMMPRGRRKPKHPYPRPTRHGSWWGVPPLTLAHRRLQRMAPGASSGVVHGGILGGCVSKQKAHANRRTRESFSQTQTVLRVSQARCMIGKRSRVQPTVVRHKSKRGAWHRVDDDKLRAEG